MEVRGGVPPQILRLGTVPLPEDALDGDRIVLVDAVANLIRGLINRLNCQTRVAVFGIGLQSVITRVLQVPRVPEEELRVVLEGELAHFHILRAGMGAFDYVPLETNAAATDGMQSVLIMAVEERVARGYRQVAEKAGLELLALEPISLALFRTTVPHLQPAADTLCLMLTPSRCELAIVSRETIRLYRRLEMGSDDLLTGRQSRHGVYPAPVDFSSDHAPFDPEPERENPPRHLDAPALHFRPTAPPHEPDTPDMGAGAPLLSSRVWTLADEIQRSVDYYHREFPGVEPITRLLMATNDPEAACLAPWLRQNLQINVRLVDPPSSMGDSAGQGTGQSAPRELRFLAGFGLALHPLTPEWRQSPRFNLVPNEPGTVPRADRERAAVLCVSGLVILVTGLIAGRLFARLADREFDNLNTSRALLASRTRTLLEIDAEIAQEKALNRIVRSDNLPVANLIDMVKAQMPAGISLDSFDLQRDGHVVISGESRTPQDFDAFYARLQEFPHFVETRYTRFNTDVLHRVTQFRIETSIYGTQDAVSRSKN